jgi:hypothetical protein
MQAKRQTDPQPLDVPTSERLTASARAIAQGISYVFSGDHETETGRNYHTTPEQVKQIIEDWPGPQKNIAETMIEKYGPPNEATPTQLFWYRNGPWKRTILSRDSIEHHWPTTHTDFLTQVIDYRVPPEMIHLVSMFDGSVSVDRTRGEVAAKCDTESANVLAMNMMHEIVTGKRTYEEARKISEESTVAYNLGRSAPYAEKMLFDIPQGGTEDIDEGHLTHAVLGQAAGKIRDVVTGEKHEATDRLTAVGDKPKTGE